MAKPSEMVVKLFSATKANEREFLGETITRWLKDQPDHLVIDEIRTMQSSDSAFHCVTMIVFGHTQEPARYEKPAPRSAPGPLDKRG